MRLPPEPEQAEADNRRHHAAFHAAGGQHARPADDGDGAEQLKEDASRLGEHGLTLFRHEPLPLERAGSVAQHGSVREGEQDEGREEESPRR